MTSHNLWLSTYTPQILTCHQHLRAYHLKGSYGGEINLLSVSRLLSGACEEITKLQNEVNKLKLELESKQNFSFFNPITSSEKSK